MRQPWICNNLHSASLWDIGIKSEEGSGSNINIARLGPKALRTELWGSLPEDLIYRVVACLPLPKMFQSRLVCKKWNILIYSEMFLRVYATISLRPSAYFPLFISFSRQRECFGYNFVTNSWQKLPPLCFLPAHVTGAVKGAGGLLCFFYHSEQSGVVVHAVCNPLTKQWRNLPHMAHKRLRPLLNHMVVTDKTTKAYKIVVADDDCCFVVPSQDRVFMTTEVYDSYLDSWSVTSRVPHKLDSNGTSAFCNGVIFCVAIDEGSGEQLGIISYNVEEGRWSKVPGRLSGNLCMTDLVECCGSVMVVAELYDNGLFVSVNIFRYDPATQVFTHLARIPDRLFVLCLQNGFFCVGHGDLICFTSYTSLIVLVFNVTMNSWFTLSSCPFARTENVYRVAAFPFEPQLDASV